MKTHLVTAATSTLVAAALCLPISASAATSASVTTVRQHTTRADAALDRAVGLFASGRDVEAAKQFALSRREIGIATSQAAKLRRDADSSTERQQAAAAAKVVAAELDQNVEQLVGVLDEADGAVENRIAQAALADTRGREKSAGVLNALARRVPQQAARGVATALQSLARNRDDEVAAEVEALSSSEVSDSAKQAVASAVKANVAGQDVAAQRLAALIASDRMPSQAKQGLQRAYDAVIAEQQRSADQLEQAAAGMPESVRSTVLATVEQARGNARDLQDNRPSAPREATPTDPGTTTNPGTTTPGTTDPATTGPGTTTDPTGSQPAR